MGKFSQEFIHNRTFDDRTTAFAPQVPESVPGEGLFNFIALDAGAEVTEDGDVRFGVNAPNAKEVKIVFGLRPKEPLVLEKGEDNIWHGVKKWDPNFVGPKAYTIFIDGAEFISSYCPIYFCYNKAVNYVEIPDPNAEFVLMRNDIPHGTVVMDYYYSDVLNCMERCLIYLPPNYEKGGEYPVLYLQHGYSENETGWVFNAKVNHIMDNMIADGEAVPFVIVMNNGMFHGECNVFADFQPMFEKSLINCCIPFIESKYRVIKDKWHRGIAGFSMGSMQSALFGTNDIDTFAWVGLLSGYMRRVGRPDSDMSKDMEVNKHLKVIFDRENFEKENKLFFRAIGGNDGTRKVFELDDEILAENGMADCKNFVRFIPEGYEHDWATMRVEFHEFAKYLFK